MYPLVTAPILKPKPWGGRRLAAFGKALPPDQRIGESWEVADLGPELTGAPGGDRTLVANGPLARASLHAVMDRWRDGLLGDASATPAGDFPLLVKLLDASEPLSVQVHPDEEYARSHPGAFHKTETWYVVAADPGAVLYLGLAGGVGPEKLAEACREGDVAPVLRAVPARAGDLHHLPAGTVHALGAGVLVAEVQTPSDTTFRLYDWARQLARAPRALHLDEAMAAIHWDETPPAPTRATGSAPLIETAAYAIARHDLSGETALDPAPNACRILMLLDGAAHLGDVSMSKGDTVIVPAALAAAGAAVRGRGTLLEIIPATQRSAPGGAGGGAFGH